MEKKGKIIVGAVIVAAIAVVSKVLAKPSPPPEGEVEGKLSTGSIYAI